MSTRSASISDIEGGGGSNMSDGIMAVVRPAVEALDAQVVSTQKSQEVLANKIQELADILHEMSQDQPYDLDVYARKLGDSRRRISSTSKILESVHDRLGRLQRDIAREAHSKKTTITAPPPAPPLR